MAITEAVTQVEISQMLCRTKFDLIRFDLDDF